MDTEAVIAGIIGIIFLGISGAIIFNSVAGFAGFLFLGLGIWLILLSVKHKDTDSFPF